MSDRLHRVLDIDETLADFRARDVAAQVQRESAGKADTDADGRALERACLRAEREGPAGWAQLLPRLTTHLEAKPQDAQAWSYLARARAAKGEESEALHAAREAMRLDPNVVLGHSLSLLVARSLAESGRWDRVAQHAEAALASQPGDGEALELLVRALGCQGLSDRAEATLSILAQSLGGSRAAALAKRLASECGRAPADRHRWLSKAAALGRGAERPFRELGEVCLVLQRDQEALQWFRKAFQQPGGDADPNAAQTLARLHVRAGNAEDALDVYRLALGAAPDNLALHRSYGQLLLKQGRSADAIHEMQQSAKLAPVAEAAELYIHVAELQQNLGQTGEALRSWESAVALDGSAIAAWRGLATAAAMQSNTPSQLRALQHLSRLDPQNPDWFAKLASLQLADGRSGAREVEEARANLERALKLSPGHPEALLRLGQLKDGSEALELLERAARADPNSFEAIEIAAAMRWSQEDYSDAAAWYKALIALRQHHSVALSRLACVALFERKVCEAEAFLERAVSSEKPSQEALALMGYVQVLLGKGDKAITFLKAAMRYPQQELHLETRLYWALALMNQNEAAAAADEFDAVAKLPGRLHQALGDAGKREALLQGRLEDAGLAKSLLPGGSIHISRLLTSLERRRSEATAVKGAGSAAVPAATPAASSTAERDAEGRGEPAGWRDALYEGQPVEVYSKSAGVWLPGKLAQVNVDMAKIKYLIHGQWCEKVLLRSSDSLRWVPDGIGQPAPAPVSPEAERGTSAGSAFVPPPRSMQQTPAAQPGGKPAPVRSTMAPEERPTSSVGGDGGGGAAAIASPSPAVVRQPASPPQPALAQPSSQRQWVQPAAADAASPPVSTLAAGSGQGAGASVPVPATAPSAAAPPSAPQAREAEPASPARRWVAPTSPAAVPSAAPSASPGVSSLAAEKARLREQMLNSSELEFGQVLGTGGFGAVYRGRYRGDEVAIKKLHIADGQVTALQIEEFRKEVENLQALRHPRLVSFIGAALTDNGVGGGGGTGPRHPPSLCIVTEFMPNGSLHALLHQRRETLTFDQRLSMAIQVTEGVVFLHGRSPPFVHRDLKSLNAVLDFALNVKLCDFGLTQSMEKTHISRRDNEGGSPRYMAPELFDSRGKITEKVDVWALGCLAVEILTGRLPHEECSSIQQVMTKVLVERKQPFLNWEDVSEDLRIIAELSFEFRPELRIDAARFLEGLQGL